MDAGQLIQSRYELAEPLGSGGMAEVWLAHDRHLGRRVAIKFLAPQLSADPEFLVRFFSEAQAVARISHPNVVRVLDFGEFDESPYLVMELVGEALTEKVDEPHEPDWAFEIVAGAARAAGAAHEHGIVHRDIKPGNILLDENGIAKLADFGIASSGGIERLTATGTAIGSPHYISPEQASGGEATPASDVYSLGIVLYELLTGTRPFEGDNITAIAIAQVEQEPSPPSSHVPELGPAIDALVLRCLSKDPAARFRDGNEMADALERALDQESVPVLATAGVSLRTGWPGRRLAVAAAVVALVVAVPLVAVIAGGDGVIAADEEATDEPLPNVGGLKIKRSPSPEVDGGAGSPAASPTPERPERPERARVRDPRSAEKPAGEEGEEPAPGPTPEPTAAEETPQPDGSPSP